MKIHIQEKLGMEAILGWTKLPQPKIIYTYKNQYKILYTDTSRAITYTNV